MIWSASYLYGRELTRCGLQAIKCLGLGAFNPVIILFLRIDLGLLSLIRSELRIIILIMLYKIIELTVAFRSQWSFPLLGLLLGLYRNHLLLITLRGVIQTMMSSCSCLLRFRRIKLLHYFEIIRLVRPKLRI